MATQSCKGIWGIWRKQTNRSLPVALVDLKLYSRFPGSGRHCLQECSARCGSADGRATEKTCFIWQDRGRKNCSSIQMQRLEAFTRLPRLLQSSPEWYCSVFFVCVASLAWQKVLVEMSTVHSWSFWARNGDASVRLQECAVTTPSNPWDVQPPPTTFLWLSSRPAWDRDLRCFSFLCR